MTLKKTLSEVIRDVGSREIHRHFDAQIRRVNDLSQILTSTHRFEAVITNYQGVPTIIFPTKADSDLEQEMREIALTQLTGDQDDINERISILGYDAHKLTRRPESQTLNLTTTGGLKIELDLINLEIPDQSSLELQKKHTSRLIASKAEQHQVNAQVGETFEIKLTPAAIKYCLIPTREGVRAKFPGYRVEFSLQNGGDTISTRIVGGRKGDYVGSKSGHYFSQGLRAFYRGHPKITETGTLVIEVVKPGEIYRVKEIKN